MTFKEFLKSLFAADPNLVRVTAPRAAPRAPSKISKAQFEARVAAQAQLLAMGQPVGAHHYLMARNVVQQDLKRANVSVQGSFREASRRIQRPAFIRQSKGIDEAEAEAGGAGKI